MEIDIPHNYKARVVIVGGGFGGIELAKKLANKNFQVIIIDKNNYHTFQPLLYQVATSALESDAIAYPIRKIFNHAKNIFFRLGEVQEINKAEKIIHLDNNDTLCYDFLVIATGAKTNYYGNEGLTISAMPMKSVVEALDLRSMILQNFEKLLRMTNERKKEGMMNIVIAGAGPTGVELAGALAELKKDVLTKDYPEIDFSQMKIYLVQSGARVLPMLSEKSSEKTQKYLEKLGVTVLLNTKVLDYSGDYVQLQGESDDIIARTLIWTAGVVGNPIAGFDNEIITRNNRILVDEFLEIKNCKDIFAIGDVACNISENYPNGHPMVAPVAIQQGHHLAKNLINKLEHNQNFKPFEYQDKGAMATIGKNKAVVEVGKIKMAGITAWFVWMFVHLMSLVGFRNRLITLLNWFKNYLNSDRGLRLIITPFDLYQEKKKRRRKLRNKEL